MEKPTLYVVGDSTLSSFNDTTYFYPRYGYATQLYNFMDTNKINIVNLALSGRSSKSYLEEKNYQFLINNIKPNDYLLIGFGHNNEKSDDVARFTPANIDPNNPNSFQYSLNEYYIQLAKRIGATPIVATPIVRLDLNKDYDGYSAHITMHGDYRLAILNLAKDENILGIDLTTPTKELFLSLSVNDAAMHHSITAAKMVDGIITPSITSVDKAHLNMYGARYVAYLLCSAIKNSNNSLKNYLYDEFIYPTIDNTLVSNPNYKIIEYKSPDFIGYMPVDHLNTNDKKWVGTCFGNVGINPLLKESGYFAYKNDNKFVIGQESLNYGRFHASTNGFVCVMKQVKTCDNFKISCNAKIIKSCNCKQSSFGLMLRDDAYLNQSDESSSAMNHYISAGFLTLLQSTNIIHTRECTTELNMSEYMFDGFYKDNEDAYLEIIRLGQSITAKVIYRGVEYKMKYMDFDLIEIDKDYMYICLYSGLGNVIEFSDVKYEYLGQAIEA